MSEALTGQPLPELAVGSDGLILWACPRALAMFGYESNELLGQTVEVLIPERFREKHVKLRETFMKSPVSMAMSTGSMLPGRRANGSEVYLLIMLVPDNQENVIRIYLMDSTPWLAAQQMRTSERLKTQMKLAAASFAAAGGFNLIMDYLKAKIGG